MTAINRMVPPNTDTAQAFALSNDAGQEFILSLALFLGNFLQSHLSTGLSYPGPHGAVHEEPDIMAVIEFFALRSTSGACPTEMAAADGKHIPLADMAVTSLCHCFMPTTQGTATLQRPYESPIESNALWAVAIQIFHFEDSSTRKAEQNGSYTKGMD